MDIRTDDLRVVDLADEFGITISETLALCKRFDIPAPYGSSIISPAAATLLRGLAKGDISPESVEVVHANPTVEPKPSVELDNGIDTDLDGFASLRGPDATDAADDTNSHGAVSANQSDDDYDYGDPDDYDSYGVAGLDDFLTAPKPDLAVPVPVAGVSPESGAGVPSVALPTTTSAGHSTSQPGQESEPAQSSAVTVSATRSALRDRGPDRRSNDGRRPGDRHRGDNDETEREEYDPTKLRAQYDDIDKYVPRWLKFVGFGALAVFGFLFYQLFFGGTAEVVDNGPQQTPIYSAGDCFNADIALWIDTMTAAGCAAEHDGEVFDSVVLVGEPGVAYPDASAMTSQARQSCRAAFSQYTGQSSFVSDYQIGVSLPTSIEWAKGDRIAYCSTISGDGTKLTGSTAKA